MTVPSDPSRVEEPHEVRAYVNERGVSVARGATALDAVRAHSAEFANQVANGMAKLTDSRGLPIDTSHVVSGGLILRVVPIRERLRVEPEADAE